MEIFNCTYKTHEDHQFRTVTTCIKDVTSSYIIVRCIFCLLSIDLTKLEWCPRVLLNVTNLTTN